MAFDENGQADTYEEKISHLQRAYDLLVNKLNFPPEDIIFDPNILAIAIGIEEHDNYAVDYINATNGLKKIYHMQKFQVKYQIYLSHLEITQ